GGMPAASSTFVGFAGVARAALPRRNTSPAANEGALGGHALAADVLMVQPAASITQRGLLGADLGTEARSELARSQPVEPLSQIAGPAAAAKAKFNSAFAASYNRDHSTQTTERAARRLSSEGEERLYESKISRVKVRGDALGWKL
ncbi:MAG: hypothetical protein ABIZ49_03740, partial [Opitutaceae bacterium]